jgi:hypothetical protein
MTVPVHEIRRTISPLRFIFWGGIICVLEISINQFDLLNDVIGTIMVTWGVFRISGIKVHDRYSTAMLFNKIVAVLACLVSIQDQIPYQRPLLLVVILSLIVVAWMIATVVFCVAMRWLCAEANLARSARSWKTTILLFVFIYLIPLGGIFSAGAVAVAMEASFNINLGPAGLLLLPVLVAPLIHLFVSTSRMKNEAQSSIDIDQQDSALDGD